jgi:hypothetical protein
MTNSEIEQKKLAALSSLALLKEDMDSQSRDYIDYLRAFIEHVIIKHAVDPVNSELVAQALSDEFGLYLPDRVIQHVLQRMVKAGHLAKQGLLYAPVFGKLPRHEEFDSRRSGLNARVQLLLNALQDHLESAGLKLSRADGLNALLRFLSRFAVNYLRAYVFKSALPDFDLKGDRTDIVLADFIKMSHDSGSEYFDDVVNLVKGQMYSNALLCPDLEGIKKDFRLVRFLLDTPLVLHLLGYHGLQHKKSAVELVDLLKSLQGKICVLTHTLQEVNQVLTNASNWVNHPNGRGHVIRCARLAGLSRTDLLVRADAIQADLNNLGVLLIANPPFDELFQISELQFQGVLEEAIEYSNEVSMRTDVESVRAIYSFRGKTVPSRLEDTLAVLVTTNSCRGSAFRSHLKIGI